MSLIAALVLSAWTVRAADTAALYEKHCLKCHGADGKGETKMGKKVGAKDLTDAKVQAEHRGHRPALALGGADRDVHTAALAVVARTVGRIDGAVACHAHRRVAGVAPASSGWSAWSRSGCCRC